MDRIRPPADNPSTRTRGVATTVPSTSVRRNLFQQPRTRRAALATTATQRVEVPESPGIVVRDRHGEIEFGDPPSPDLEDRGELPLDSRQESEKERQKLAEAVRQHQINSSALPDQPEELLEAVKASLKAKVAALAEDNWMYEPEEPVRLS